MTTTAATIPTVASVSVVTAVITTARSVDDDLEGLDDLRLLILSLVTVEGAFDP